MATKFITVGIGIMHDKKLSPNQKFILAEIEQLCSLEKGCIATNKHFAELVGISNQGVSNAIGGLKKMGYIKVDNTETKRNHGRIITIHSDVGGVHSDVVGIHSDVESKENRTKNITIIEDPVFSDTRVDFEKFIKYIKKDAPIKSKVVSNDKGFEYYKSLTKEDREKVKDHYIHYQKEKGEFSPRIPDFMMDFQFYKKNYSPKRAQAPRAVVAGENTKKRKGGYVV